MGVYYVILRDSNIVDTYNFNFTAYSRKRFVISMLMLPIVCNVPRKISLSRRDMTYDTRLSKLLTISYITEAANLARIFPYTSPNLIGAYGGLKQ